MTEAEWLECTDPMPMLEFLKGKASDRKLRLFAVACCRRIWHLLVNTRSQNAVEVAERFAQGQASLAELLAAADAAIVATWVVRDELDAAWPAEPTSGVLLAAEAAEMCASSLPNGQVWGAEGGYGAWDAAVEATSLGAAIEVREQEEEHQGLMLRCIFGNPFRLLTLAAPWLTSRAKAIAQAIYDNRTFDRLPILADALEEAGCNNADILAHCRSPRPHVRGCWVLDLVLGKS